MPSKTVRLQILAAIALAALVGCASSFNSANWKALNVPPPMADVVDVSEITGEASDMVGLNDATTILDLYIIRQKAAADKIVNETPIVAQRFQQDIDWWTGVKAFVDSFSVQGMAQLFSALGVPGVGGMLGLLGVTGFASAQIRTPGQAKKGRQEGKSELVSDLKARGIEVPAELVTKN